MDECIFKKTEEKKLRCLQALIFALRFYNRKLLTKRARERCNAVDIDGTSMLWADKRSRIDEASFLSKPQK